MAHALWRKVRRPFRYPQCQKCTWEVYDAHLAGCLKCGRSHECKSNAVDSRCPLVLCEDASRVCDITGYVLPEVRHAATEYTDTAVYTENALVTRSTDGEVHSILSTYLLGQHARDCRAAENSKLLSRLSQHLYKTLKNFKVEHPHATPNVCHMLALALSREKHWHFIEEPSESLVQQCAQHIETCLKDLHDKGVKVSSGTRMQELVCGLLFMLQNGLIYRTRVLLPAIPEIQRCLPPENKIRAFFGVSSKIICMTENEVKMVFREFYQK